MDQANFRFQYQYWILFSALIFILLAYAQLTSIKHFEGYSDQTTCAQCAFEGCEGRSYLGSEMGCKGWKCICDRIDIATSVISSLVSRECKATQNDVDSAAAVLTSFCSKNTFPPTTFAVTTPTTSVSSPHTSVTSTTSAVSIPSKTPNVTPSNTDP